MKCHLQLGIRKGRISELLRNMGLSLDDPDVWIGDTGATTHTTAYINDTVNHQNSRIETRCGPFRTTSQSKKDCSNQSMKERRTTL
jgi:hypothetical protein